MAALRHLLRHSSAATRISPAFFSASAAQQVDPAPSQELDPKRCGAKLGPQDKLVLYKARWLLPLRMLVRLKIIQLGGLAALVVPATQYASGGHLTVQTLGTSAGVVLGATGASLALWYYSRRYIGELALLPPYPSRVQISTIDFWGNRQNLQVNVRDVDPPLRDLSQAELIRMAHQVLVPLDVKGQRQFCISLRHGHLVNKKLLFKLLDGTLEGSNIEELLGNLEEKTSKKET